jgi:DNA topoisomerase-1
VTSSDVNRYLRDITGKDVTAKDFRTWAGTVLAGIALKEVEAFGSDAQAKRNVRTAIEHVANRLGNTPNICRKCYIHPEVLGAYMDGSPVNQLTERSEKILRDHVSGLEPEEAAVLALLRSRLKSSHSAKDIPGLREQLHAVSDCKRRHRGEATICHKAVWRDATRPAPHRVYLSAFSLMGGKWHDR